MHLPSQFRLAASALHPGGVNVYAANGPMEHNDGCIFMDLPDSLQYDVMKSIDDVYSLVAVCCGCVLRQQTPQWNRLRQRW